MHKNTKNNFINPANLSIDKYGDINFVKSYAGKIEYNSHNALYERPATLSLLPDVCGKKILDAGCGPGLYSAWLTERGAEVTAVDYSDEMIKLTEEITENKARVVKANLNDTLDFLKDNEFDIVLSSLVIHYISDLRGLFSEFNRVLKSNGHLIISTHHPFSDFAHHPESNYFETELITEKWPSYNVEMQFYRRPLSEIFNMFKEADFRIDEFLEPLPLEICKEVFPDAYEELPTKPCFIFFKAVKEK